MKKLFGLILTLVAAVALVGCGGTEQKDPSIAENNYTVETIENLKAQADDSVLVSFRIPFGTNIQAIIREFADEVDWWEISFHQDLSESFRKEFADKLF
jgi:major membrane immunogen (membrane-anchored lipoprotein)